MRGLIIGGAGAIGSAVARHALARGDEVHVAQRVGSDLRRLRPYPDLRRHQLVLAEAASVAAVLERAQPDWIVMAAFPAHGPASDTAKAALLQASCANALGLLSALASRGFRGPLVWLGSALAYGRDGGVQDASRFPLPENFRGAAKAIESVLVSQFAREAGLAVTELRVSTGYGSWEQAQRLVPRLLRAGIGGEAVSLATKDWRRDWIHYEDIARACLACAERTPSGHRILDAGSGEVHDIREVAAILERITGKRLLGAGRFDRRETYGDALPASLPRADQLDWQPRVGLEDGLERSWRWAQSAQGRAWLLETEPACA